MPLYFKYLKYYGLEELLDCAIRISAPSTLNDPFEAKLNREVEYKLLQREKISSIEGLEECFSPENCERMKKGNLYKKIHKFGIVSLSKRNDNLLMWAHYADEHKGICIGYQHDFFEAIPKKNITGLKIESYTPLKVEYSKTRPQYYTQENIEIHKYIRQQLLTKSRDWKYECEYRCIVPMSWADKFKLIKNSNAKILISSIKGNLPRLKKEIGKEVYRCNDMSILASNLYKEKEAIFLKNICPSKIHSIYLGSRFSKIERHKLVKEIENKNSKLHHVKLYQCDISKNEFKLVRESLMPAKIKK